MHALKQKGNFGLFFIDGHTDFMYPEYSFSKRAAALELALVTGNGHASLSNIDDLRPYVNEEDVFCVGNREMEDKTIELITATAIRYIDINELRTLFPVSVVNSFLSQIRQRGLDGFWIHLDVDVLQDSLMPCVDHSQPGGLTYRELGDLLRPLLRSALVYGIDITIYNPVLDNNYHAAKEFVRNFKSWLA